MMRQTRTISSLVFPVLLIAMFSGVPFPIDAEPLSPVYEILDDGTKIIENKTFTSQVNLIGEEYSNLVMRNCIIENLPRKESGIYLRGVSNLLIENCTIRNLRGFRGGGGRGIRLSSREENYNVVIRDCLIENVESDGISVSQRSGEKPVQNAGIKIINNTIRNVAVRRRPLTPGRLHGIYCQGSDFLIEGNVIHDVGDGNGISVRSSGTIRGNTVYNVGAGDPIRYYNDHEWGRGGELLIENNICYDESYERGQRAMISLVYDKSHPEYRGDSFLIRSNICLVLDERALDIYVAEEYADDEVVVIR